MRPLAPPHLEDHCVSGVDRHNPRYGVRGGESERLILNGR
jgi:hypothetical protein